MSLTFTKHACLTKTILGNSRAIRLAMLLSIARRMALGLPRMTKTNYTCFQQCIFGLVLKPHAYKM